jgi:hypothetical protein
MMPASEQDEYRTSGQEFDDTRDVVAKLIAAQSRITDLEKSQQYSDDDLLKHKACIGDQRMEIRELTAKVQYLETYARCDAETIEQLQVRVASVAFSKIAADRLAYAVAKCVERGSLDSRSGPADALLNYLEIGGIGGFQSVPDWVADYEAKQKKANP